MEKLWNNNYRKAWCANFMMYFSFMILTPLLPLYLSEEFGANKDQIGLVLSGYALTALLIRPFSGFFVDSFLFFNCKINVGKNSNVYKRKTHYTTTIIQYQKRGLH